MLWQLLFPVKSCNLTKILSEIIREAIDLKEKTLIHDFTTGNPLKQLLTFALPFVFANLLQQAYNMADMIIIGQFVGSVGLTAASNAGEISMLFLFVSMGIANAGQIVLSQHIGSGNRERLGKTIGTLFTLGFFIGIFCTIVSLLVCDGALRLIKVPEEALPHAHDYGMTYFCGMLPVFGYNLVSSILRGMGDSKHPFVFIAIAAVLNIGLDLLFVGAFKWGCFGAALATIISQTVSFVVSIVFLIRHKDEFGFDFKLKSFRIDRRELKPILTLGLPICVQSIAISGSMLYINSLINVLGVTSAATTAVGNKLTLIATVCTDALNSAGNSIVGQNFAARNFKRVKNTIWYIMGISVAFCLFLGAMLMLFPEPIFSIFDKDAEVLAMSHVYALFGAINLLGFATRAPSFALLNGIGYSKLSFFCSLGDGIVARIGFSVLFGKVMEMGIRGYWLGGALAGNVIGVIIFFYFISGKWKQRKLLIA